MVYLLKGFIYMIVLETCGSSCMVEQHFNVQSCKNVVILRVKLAQYLFGMDIEVLLSQGIQRLGWALIPC